MIKSEFEISEFLGSLLVQMYIKCEALEDAYACFDNMHERNVFAWNFLLGAYVQNGQTKLLLQLFAQMQQEGVLPDRVTFVYILSACASQTALAQGKWMHGYIMCSGFESNVFVATALLSMYAKCGRVDDAQRVFNKMPDRNVVSWNAIIAAYEQHGLGKEAFQLFEEMQREGIVPDMVTVVSMFSACASHAALFKGRNIHACLDSNSYESDVFVATALLNMYGKCGSLQEAWKMFGKMQERNVVSWNAMITVYAQHEHGKEALQLFSQMQEEGVSPDKITFVSILAACASMRALDEGQRIHSQVTQSSYCLELDVVNALINMYGSCGSLEEAQTMFDRLPMQDIISWNVLIAGYAQHGQGKEALQLFDQMQCEGWIPDKVTFIGILNSYTSPLALGNGKRIHIRIKRSGLEGDVVVATALVNMYGKCGSLEDARRMFDRMTEYNVVSWNTMIGAYAQHGLGKEALQLFDLMQEGGFVPNKITLVSLLSACANQAALAEGKQIHARIRRCGLEGDVMVASALVNMYSKCGSLEDARLLFEKMPSKDSVSWNTIITAYGQHGHVKEALQLYRNMQREGAFPNKVTCVGMLSACGHTGLFKEAYCFLESICYNRTIALSLKHYDCVIDLLGRMGRLDEAEELLNSMPFQPSAVSWMTLLGACRNQHDVERGKRIAKQIFEMDPNTPPACVMLSNIYAAAGMGDEAEQIREGMRNVTMMYHIESGEITLDI